MNQTINTLEQLQLLSDYQIVEVSGEDSLKLLQGQLTCDIQKVTESQAQLGGYCNIKGRLLSIFYALKYNQSYWLIMPKSVSTHFIETLSKYAVFFQAEIGIKADCALVAQLSTGSQDFLGQTLKSKTTNEQAGVEYCIKLISENHCQLAIKSAGVTAQTNLNIFVGSDADSQAKDWISERLQSESCEASSNHLLNLIQLAYKIPMVFESSIEKFLPHSIGLPEVKGVDFEKGCYIGQEIVARMHYRATLKNHVHLASLVVSESVEKTLSATELSPFSAVYNNDDKKVGEIIFSVQDQNCYYILLSLADSALESKLYTSNKIPLNQDI